MKKILGAYKPIEVPVCLTLGVFDGIHRGHKILLSRLNNISQRTKCRSCVLTFYPHPQKVLGVKFEGLIYPFYYRLKLLKTCNIDYCILIGFDRNLSKLSAVDFFKRMKTILKNIRIVLVGEDFRMGSDRMGVEGLKDFVLSQGINFIVIRDIFSSGEKISSTLIKNNIKKADFKRVECLLGRKYFIVGSVKKSRGMGRKIGFPTANIDTGDLILPPEGVYSAEVSFKRKNFSALLSIGRRPTFGQSRKICVEVYIPSFTGSIYGEVIEVRPRHFIRRQKKFSSSGALALQITRDVKVLNSYL